MQALFTLYGFTFPITVALLQMAVIAPVCYIVARPKLEWGLARGIIPLAVVNVLNVVCGLIGEPELSLSLGRGLVHAVCNCGPEHCSDRQELRRHISPASCWLQVLPA